VKEEVEKWKNVAERSHPTQFCLSQILQKLKLTALNSHPHGDKPAQ